MTPIVVGGTVGGVVDAGAAVVFVTGTVVSSGALVDGESVSSVVGGDAVVGELRRGRLLLLPEPLLLDPLP